MAGVVQKEGVLRVNIYESSLKLYQFTFRKHKPHLRHRFTAARNGVTRICGQWRCKKTVIDAFSLGTGYGSFCRDPSISHLGCLSKCSFQVLLQIYRIGNSAVVAGVICAWTAWECPRPTPIAGVLQLNASFLFNFNPLPPDSESQSQAVSQNVEMPKSLSFRSSESHMRVLKSMQWQEDKSFTG